MVDRKLEGVRIRAWALLVVKVSLLTTFLFATNQGIVDRIISIGWQSGLLVFFGCMAPMHTCGAAFFLGGIPSPPFKARMFWSVALGVVAFFGLTFQKITASYLSFSEVERLVGLIGFVDDVLAFYVGIIASGSGLECSRCGRDSHATLCSL